jgi:hypothetical protein
VPISKIMRVSHRQIYQLPAKSVLRISVGSRASVTSDKATSTHARAHTFKLRNPVTGRIVDLACHVVRYSVSDRDVNLNMYPYIVSHCSLHARRFNDFMSLLTDEEIRPSRAKSGRFEIAQAPLTARCPGDCIYRETSKYRD